MIPIVGMCYRHWSESAGVLAHVSGMLAITQFQYPQLAVGETENPELSRMTFVVHAMNERLIRFANSSKRSSPWSMFDDRSVPIVERDLLLVRCRSTLPSAPTSATSLRSFAERSSISVPYHDPGSIRHGR